MIRARTLACLLLAIVACHTKKPEPWTTGFWFWQGSTVATQPAGDPVDSLYVQAGTIRPQGVAAHLPEKLPAAREYWMVLRADNEFVPSETMAGELARATAELAAQAQSLGLPIRGVQLDVDTPTRALSTYARFLHAVKGALPQNLELSITALLDWFHDGTAIRDVVHEVDEFVPQFYDVAVRDRTSIATRIDAARWAPVFARYGKRFRIGISSFGRVRLASSNGHNPYDGRVLAGISPAELSNTRELARDLTTNAAGEAHLTFRVLQPLQLSFLKLEPGQSIEVVMATRTSVASAMAEARRMGPHCAGVLFFRWPAAHEAMALTPNETLDAAGVRPQQKTPPIIHAVDGNCTPAQCFDLYLSGLDRLSPQDLRYSIDSSEPLTYFLPQDRVASRLVGRNRLEVVAPAYGLRSRMLVGRAFTRGTPQFRIACGESTERHIP